jgi:8-amino-7-oxononanoate synthase
LGLRDKIAAVEQAYGRLKALGRDPSTLQFETVTSPTEAVLDGRPVTLFGTNNYLGLTFDPDCVAAAAEASRAQGAGTTGSRIANGSYRAHRELEREIASFYGKRSAIVFSTGYVANLGMISVLAGKGDYLLIDADSHASIYDGCRMSEAHTIRFRHNDPANLARRLERLAGDPGDKIVIVEGIYSMLGDMAPLAEFAAVTRAAGENAYLLVDEAHSLGVLGAHGRGQCEAEGVEADCDFIVGTFSKSVGTTGGFCVSNIEGFDRLRMLSRPYMFTASMTPGAVATARAAFRIMTRRPALRETLWQNVGRLSGGVRALGIETGPAPSPIVALKLPDPETAVRFWNRLIDEGIYTNIAIPPATPNGLSLLRVSVSAAHDVDQIERALDVMALVGGELGIVASDRRRPARPRPPAFRVISGARPVAEDGRVRPAPQPMGSAVPKF